jgi:hypothetical protein
LTTVVLLILAGVWAAVIIIPLVKARAEGSAQDSIGSFQRQLSVLQRATPTVVTPANRMRAEAAAPGMVAPYRPATRPTAPYGASPTVASVARPLGAAAASAALYRRRAAQRRRRDVILSLAAGAAGSFLLSFLPSLHVLLWLSLLLAAVLAGYLALLVRMHNLAVERESKISYLPSALPVTMASYREAGAAAGYPRASSGKG